MTERDQALLGQYCNGSPMMENHMPLAMGTGYLTEHSIVMAFLQKHTTTYKNVISYLWLA